MLVLLVLALIVLGAVLGRAGLRRLGRWTRRAAGRWRPGTGVGAVILAFAGLALSVRGLFPVGLALLAASGVLAVATRRRGGAPWAAPSSQMSEAEARSLLGVPQAATREEIRAAYLRLIRRAHPDHGGTSGLAAQLNAARERLLG
jgi:hypothetical protein